jgi:AcrR family transcriptional regulator
MSERMERKKRLKRNMIIDKAEKIMAKKGYYDMTMDEVAADADVAKGTIYLYFNSKEALCAAVVARIIENMNEAMREKLAGVEGGELRIASSVGSVIEWNATHPDKSWVLENVMSLNFKDVSDVNVQDYVGKMDDQLQIMRENFELAIKEGVIRSDLDPVTTSIFLRMALWVAINPFSSHELLMKVNGVDKEALLKNALDFLRHGMRNNESDQAAHKGPLANDRRFKASN